MKTIILSIILAGGFLMFGCAHKCPSCPPEDAFILAPYAGPVLMPKGFLDDRDNWKNKKDFEEWIQKMKDQRPI